MMLRTLILSRFRELTCSFPSASNRFITETDGNGGAAWIAEDSC
jgi:hypothetical protein